MFIAVYKERIMAVFFDMKLQNKLGIQYRMALEVFHPFVCVAQGVTY